MGIDSKPVLSSAVRERDIDLGIVQLVQTSPEFRHWLLNRLVPESEMEQFLGVSHSVETVNGESDIEIGFKAEDNSRHRVLIENKIDTSFGDRQIERYFERGQKYVDEDTCDTATVGLTAPETYISDEERESFDGFVSYEKIAKHVDTLSHDGVPYIKEILELAIDKYSNDYNKYPDLTEQIRDRVSERASEFPEIEPYDLTNNLVKFRSTAADHPSTVRYMVWVQGPDEGKEAMVRLSISSDISDEDIDAHQALLTDHFDELDGFRLKPDVTMGTVRTTVRTESIDDEYVDNIVSALQELVAFYHPIVVDSDL